MGKSRRSRSRKSRRSRRRRGGLSAMELSNKRLGDMDKAIAAGKKARAAASKGQTQMKQATKYSAVFKKNVGCSGPWASQLAHCKKGEKMAGKVAGEMKKGMGLVARRRAAIEKKLKEQKGGKRKRRRTKRRRKKRKSRRRKRRTKRRRKSRRSRSRRRRR